MSSITSGGWPGVGDPAEWIRGLTPRQLLDPQLIAPCVRRVRALRDYITRVVIGKDEAVMMMLACGGEDADGLARAAGHLQVPVDPDDVPGAGAGGNTSTSNSSRTPYT